MSDVVDINEGKKKKPGRPKKEETPKISLTEMMLEFCDLLDRAGEYNVVPISQQWPHRTIVLPDSGEVAYADDVTGVCRLVTRDQVEMDWREWIASGMSPPGMGHWNGVMSKTIQDCIRYFVCKSRNRVQPETILVGLDDRPCWARIAIDPWKETITDGDPRIENFEKFTSRCGKGEVTIKQWIGSLFFPMADRSQYLWLYGKGDDGKSKLIKMLEAMMGSAFRSTIVRDKETRFWSACTRGKRLVALPDNNAYNITTTQVFKQLTGEDTVEFEQKGKDTYQGANNAKFIISSNKMPILTGERSDMRRALVFEVDPIVGAIDETYEQKIIGEGSAIIGHCMAHYVAFLMSSGVDPATTFRHPRLPVTNQEELEAVVEDGQGDVTQWLDLYVNLQPGADKMSNAETKMVLSTEYHRLLKETNRSDYRMRMKIKEYLLNIGVKMTRVKAGDKPLWFIKGMEFKPPARRVLNLIDEISETRGSAGSTEVAELDTH